MIEVVDAGKVATRHVNLAWRESEYSILTVVNYENRERVVQPIVSPEWLDVEPNDHLLLPPLGRQQIILRVNWSVLPAVVKAEGRIIFIEDCKELWRIGVSATADVEEEQHVVVLGDGVVDFGEFHLETGPMAPSPPKRFLRHEMTISADRGSFSGRLFARRKWLYFTLRNGKEIVDPFDFTLEPGEAGRISICVDLLGVKPNRSHYDKLRVESTPDGNEVASLEVKFKVRATRRPLEILLPSQLDFGQVLGSLVIHRTVALYNDGYEAVEASVRGSPKWLNVSFSDCLDIAQGSVARVEIATQPPLSGYQNGEVSFLFRSSNGDSRVLTLPVFGTFVEPIVLENNSRF